MPTPAQRVATAQPAAPIADALRKAGVAGGMIAARRLAAIVAVNVPECLFWVCAVTRRRFPVGASPTRRFAPAGSNRSRHGGDEMSEAFG